MTYDPTVAQIGLAAYPEAIRVVKRLQQSIATSEREALADECGQFVYQGDDSVIAGRYNAMAAALVTVCATDMRQLAGPGVALGIKPEVDATPAQHAAFSAVVCLANGDPMASFDVLVAHRASPDSDPVALLGELLLLVEQLTLNRVTIEHLSTPVIPDSPAGPV